MIAITQQEKLVQTMSEEQFAAWFVRSLHTVILSSDPAIAKSGFFTKELLQNLIIGVLVKGGDVFFPPDHAVPQHQVIQTLIESLIIKIKQLTNGTLSEQALNNFVKDLPLPPAIKEKIIPHMQKKIEELKNVLQASQKFETIYKSSVDQLTAMPGGSKIVSLTEKLTAEILENGFRKSEQLISHFGFTDALEAFISEYMPGMEIHDDLKNWFKRNISELGINHLSSEPIDLLKKGIQTILLHSFANLAQKKYNKKSEKLIAQIVNEMKKGLAKAFPHFSEQEKGDFAAAWTIQEHIRKNKQQMQVLKKKNEQLLNRLKDLCGNGEIKPFKELIRVSGQAEKAKSHIAHLTEIHAKNLGKLHFEGVSVKDEYEPILEFQQYAAKELKQLKQKFPNENELALAEIMKGEITKVLSKGHPKKIETHLQLKFKQYNSLIQLLSKAPDELELIKETIAIEELLESSRQDLNLLEKQILHLSFDLLADAHNRKALKAAEAINLNNSKIFKLNHTRLDLEKQLDEHLSPFKVLSTEWMALIGLDEKEKSLLPPFLQEKVWGYIELAKQKQIPRVLFEHLSPMIPTYFNREANKAKLRQLTGNDLLGNMCSLVAKEALDKASACVSLEALAFTSGGKDLKAMLEPQLKSLLAGKEDGCQEQRKSIRDAIESILLLQILKIVEQNGGANFFETISSKLVALLAAVKKDNLSDDQIAELGEKILLVDILGWKSGSRYSWTSAGFMRPYL